MGIFRRMLLVIALALAAAPAAVAQETGAPERPNQCILCHGNREVWEGETLHLFVTAADVSGDIHWQRGLRCHDCHGGDPNTTKVNEAHAVGDANGLRVIAKPADVPVFCGHCHSDAKYMEKYQPAPKTNQVDQFWASVHGQHLKKFGDDKTNKANAASCTACHPKHRMRAATDPLASTHPKHLIETCGDCHKDQRTAMRKSVHHAAGERNEFDVGMPLDCLKCHGRSVHDMPPVRDIRSPVYLENQVSTCGECHKKDLATYERSLHGRGLYESGLQITAVCSNCHGAHDIYYAADKRSKLNPTNVAATCAKCHRYIDERLEKSVHGGGLTGSGGLSEHRSAGGKSERKPSCADCHQGHDPARPDSADFRAQLPNRCGNCHNDYSLRYGMSVHGQLTQLGYAPAAKCSDCHGAHDILPLSNSASRMAGENRFETCRKCHLHAVANFAGFDPHASYKDAEHYPLLSTVFTNTETVLFLLFGLWLLHAALWFARSFIQTLRFGRHQRLVTKQYAIVRFTPFHRTIYVITLISLLGLMLTGLPLHYSGEGWAPRLARSLGGFDSTSIWHRACGLLLLSACGLHLIWAFARAWMGLRQAANWQQFVFGPDSPVPNFRDLRDLWGMLRWFFGRGRKPQFERWTYWEKFDYWAMYLMMIWLGLSGFSLWFPNLVCRIAPGWMLNLANVIHADTGLLVASLMLIIHLFNTHFRPEKFPLDLSMLTGLVSEEHLEVARPEFLERMRREGKLDEMRVIVPPRRSLRPAAVSGFLVVTLGLILLLAILLAALGK